MFTYIHTCIHTYVRTYMHTYIQAPPSIKYITSLYLIVTTVTTVGYGDVTMVAAPELVLAIFIMGFGATIFAAMVGNLSALLANMDSRCVITHT